jgi:putative addiction module component (TIGR02574 family)
MLHTLAEIEQQARDLPAQERARLALALIQSLEPTDEADVEEPWRVEVEARWASIERGAAETIAAPEVFAEIRRALR